jgi:hypothetical protein
MNQKNRIAVVTCLAAGCAVLVPGRGLAQATPPASPAPAPLPPPLPPPAAPSAAPAPAPAAPTVVHAAVPEPAPAVEPPPTSPKKEDDVAPDHERVVGHFGITYFDIAALPIANPVPAAGTNAPVVGTGTGTPITSSTVSAPVVGVRYWLKPNLGIDVGMGLGIGGGHLESVNGSATPSTDTKADKIGTWGFALHGGLPIALYHGRHYSFLAIPGFTLGLTGGTFTPASGNGLPAAPAQDLSGFLFDIGGQIGAEVHFGFIGIPELALQATVGLSYRRTTFKWKSDVNSASDATDSFGTNVQSNPWAIFTNNISATYYF